MSDELVQLEFVEAYARGHRDGYRQGHAGGYAEGYAEGYDVGSRDELEAIRREEGKA